MRGPVSPYQRLVMCALCAKNNAKQKCVRYLVPRRIVSRFRHNGQRNSQRDARPGKNQNTNTTTAPAVARTRAAERT